jgi:DNA-binding GntR family transcriptional regulator
MNNRAQSNGTIDGLASEDILKSDVKPTPPATKAYEFIKTEILRLGLAPGEVVEEKGLRDKCMLCYT